MYYCRLCKGIHSHLRMYIQVQRQLFTVQVHIQQVVVCLSRTTQTQVCILQVWLILPEFNSLASAVLALQKGQVSAIIDAVCFYQANSMLVTTYFIICIRTAVCCKSI